MIQSSFECCEGSARLKKKKKEVRCLSSLPLGIQEDTLHFPLFFNIIWSIFFINKSISFVLYWSPCQSFRAFTYVLLNVVIYGFTHSRTVTSNTDFPRKPPGIKVHHQSTLGAKYGQQIILLSLFILRGKIPILWLQWSHWFLCVCVKSMHSRLLSHFSIFYAFFVSRNKN